jgi:hypothetical protein
MALRPRNFSVHESKYAKRLSNPSLYSHSKWLEPISKSISGAKCEFFTDDECRISREIPRLQGVRSVPVGHGVDFEIGFNKVMRIRQPTPIDDANVAAA